MPGYFIHLLITVIFSIITANFVSSQATNPEAVKKMIRSYKLDPRGPYLDIRWFCQDGSTRTAKDPCPDIPGNQRARYKSAVIDLAKKEHIFLGQILTTTPYPDFWDDKNVNSRLVQYQLEKYLRGIDNGWINRKAQYYRGAIQVEDENNWGVGFFTWLLADDNKIKSKYYLIRQSARYIPHAADDKNAQSVRFLSREISDSLLSFQEIRIKIHNMPDSGDIQRVQSFMQKNKAKIPVKLKPKFDLLLQDLKIMYKPFEVVDLEKYRKKLAKNSGADLLASSFIKVYPGYSAASEKCLAISKTALSLRQELLKPLSGQARLAIIDMINRLEGLLNVEITKWETTSLRTLTLQLYCLAEAATAFGFLELWEWKELQGELVIPPGPLISLKNVNNFTDRMARVMQWSTGMVWAHYKSVIDVYNKFEPLASGFYDELVRSSILLHMGEKSNRLADFFSKQSGFSNAVFDMPSQSSIRGVNPGYATGELVVIRDHHENINFSPHKIYIIREAPANLKPVAGILSVSEGNLVSHIQLLARNLGIPSAIISSGDMEQLGKHEGSEVFFAVSKKGTVIMKAASDMVFSEKELFREKKHGDSKISVPVHRIHLEQTKILNLRDINAEHSGIICGPKAANLGQLKSMFPENVVEGIVIPFGVFRKHMDQNIPGKKISYWQKMTTIFDAATQMRELGDSETNIEKYILNRLDTLRTLVKNIAFSSDFKSDLEQQFLAVFNQPLGKVPVFIRSDTNMEDLKDFTGAGLNLTVFNVLDVDKIMQGIRDVWASPYSERSYLWRQRFLLNPENVFPSILIMPGVNADKSGVLVTKGLTTGKISDMTIAFNRGVGGAVDGQAAESWLIPEQGTFQLLSPSRELNYLSIPETGGSIRQKTSFDDRILTEEDLLELKTFSDRIREKAAYNFGMDNHGPFDIELAFKNNKVWLFQVRPYVENKQAVASEYLEMISPAYDQKKMLSLDEKM